MVFLGDFRQIFKQGSAALHITMALLALLIVVRPGSSQASEAYLADATPPVVFTPRNGADMRGFRPVRSVFVAEGARVAQVEKVSSREIQVSQAAPNATQPAGTSPAAVTPPAPSTSGTATPSGEPVYKRHASPPGASVYFEYPTNGATVPQTLKIRFGLIGMGVAPAGFDKAYTGHHHLIIDAPLPPLDQPVPNDFNHLHFALGQTEAVVTLPLGRHTLQLLFADANHVPHLPAVYSKPIEVLVTANGKKPHHSKKHKR